jgi:neutral ceramidase
MIGTNQFKAALELWNNASYDLVGHVGYIHQFVDMQNVEVDLTYSGTGQNETTCLGGLGDAFAAGTTDGPGAFNFQQGTNDSNPNGFWNIIAGFLSEPTPEQKKCQYPKPILFNTGGITFPCPWTASILPLQIVNWGQLYIIAVPGEFTTMSGRRYLPCFFVSRSPFSSNPCFLLFSRLRNTVTSVLEANGVQNPIVVIAGLSNSYSHYITTTEEYRKSVLLPCFELLLSYLCVFLL